MRWRNNRNGYGAIAVSLHWAVAVLVVVLFALGLWMTELSYYDPWYRKGPALHKAIGVLTFTLVILRLVWRLASVQPAPLASHAPLERRAARVVHAAIYLLLCAIPIAGYLISTADGRALEVLDGFEIPATITSIEHQEDVAGVVHLTLAITLMSLVALHAAASLKHHFVDKDRTLLRMLGR